MFPTTQQIYIMNPITRRSIVKGGRVYKKLVKDRLFNPITNKFIDQTTKIKQPHVDEEKDFKKNEEKKEEEKKEEEHELSKLIEELHGEKIDGSEISKLMAEASKNVMLNFKDELSKITNDVELYAEVRDLINSELKLLLKIHCV